MTASTRVRSFVASSPASRPSTTLRAALVDGAPPSTIEETTCTAPARARSDSAPRSAAAFIFLGVFCV